MISLRDVSTSYGPEPVLRNVSFQAAAGELVACVGPSGSGKTTMLNVIAGLLTPDEGEVRVAGTRVDQLSPPERSAFRRQNVAFVFQTFNLLPYLTALQNVELPLYLAGADRLSQRERAQAFLEQVGLNGKSVRLPSQLSVGEQQRVAIARALANRPRVLLADEPTGNLDSQTGNEITQCLRSVAGEGVTLVLVTHDSAVARVADRTVTLKDGRVLP